jgi:WhiB family redox-sensing transcriptional regulator
VNRWRDKASCVGHDPDIWFPASTDSATLDTALAICRGCPVVVECGRFAEEHRRVNGYGLQGVWGGRLWGGKAKA